MDPAKQKEIASKGGRAAHLKGTAHRWSEEEAKEAGRKGGAASHRNGHRTTEASRASEELPPDDTHTEEPRTAEPDGEEMRNGG
jgi:hypothetical protein